MDYTLPTLPTLSIPFYPLGSIRNPIDPSIIRAYQGKITLRIQVMDKKLPGLNIFPLVKLWMEAPNLQCNFYLRYKPRRISRILVVTSQEQGDLDRQLLNCNSIKSFLITKSPLAELWLDCQGIPDSIS